jgi:GT2 family glycosyltransferase
MKNYPLVVIIILNWNGWEDTLECLESVYEISYPNYMVIVVDNHSTDDSLEKIRKYCSGQITTESTFTNNGKPNNLLELIELSEEDLNDTEYIFNEGYSGLNNKLILIKNKVNYGFAGGNNVALKYAMEKSAAEYILLLNNDTVVHEDFLTELVLVAESNKEIGIVGPKLFYDNKKTIQWAAGGFLDIEHFKVEI